ncbi:hypothetical protein Bca52824_069333 [Brassica carinata]|uniref:Uncharacterized protein n=1 Tax=Brassica carinata TaxID=52824 RepID=A0A8X7Q717_BRACI|nr:hypothetical protein Bca52824_069333 [Brassica carinata]
MGIMMKMLGTDEEGEKEKEDVEQEARNHDEDGEKEKEKEESEYKLMQERSRVQADAFWKGVDEQEKRELAEIAEEEEREKEKKIAEEEKEESESGDEERVEESEAEEDEKVEEEEKAEESESSEKEKEKKKEKEKEKEMSGDEADIIMASVLSEINESPVEYATQHRHHHHHETPTPPPRETPTTPKKLKLPPVDLNKNPVEEEEFGGKEVRVTQPEILLRCKEKTETYGKPRPRSSGKKATPTAGPKNRGRPRMRAVDAAPPITGKRKSEPSQWVQTPFTTGKKGRKKTKTKA